MKEKPRWMKTVMFQWKPHPMRTNCALSKAIGIGPWEGDRSSRGRIICLACLCKLPRNG